MKRIIPYLFRATQIFIGHCACGRAEIFGRFAGVRPATLCFFLACAAILDFRCRCFADGANIFSAGSLENVLRPINVFAFIRMNGD
jgi:hypothetical protein